MSAPLSKSNFERQFTAASRRGSARRRSQPLATRVRYDAHRGLMIDLNNDCLVCVPLRLLPELDGAAPSDLRRVVIMGIGQAIEWPTLDQQFDVLQLLADTVGAKLSLATVRDRAARVKAKGARANGAKGGRPRKRRQASV